MSALNQQPASAIQWLGDNELVALRVDEVLYLEYPSSWDTES